MRMRAALALLTLLPLSLFTVAADGDEACSVLDAGALADDPSDDVLACETTQYLGGCDGYAGGKLYHDLVHSPTVPLVEDAPSGSFTSGAGCGTVEEPFLTTVTQGGTLTFDVLGYMSANPQTLTVELHDISASTMRANRRTTLGVRLTIERVSPFGTETRAGATGTEFEAPIQLDVPVTAVASSTGVSDMLVFTVTNLDAHPEIAELYEAGRGEELEVFVTIDPPVDGGHGFVWGATEVPANITINGEVRGTTIDARTGRIRG